METIASLFDIIKKLRGKNGCPWDQKQTGVTMFKCLAEELYELEEAIAKDDTSNICEELGDVLFQLAFILEIYREQGRFSFDDVTQNVCTKMIRRHPHVYENASIASEKELYDQWEDIKSRENKANGKKIDSALDSVPKGMPSLIRAYKVSKSAVKAGFDWDTIEDVMGTVE
ncbi:MAG: MazG family protein, partial [Desulfobacteraceae bacterium]|nr:MazG family protein [Desulfobacteraceae bacterium]